MKFPDDKHQGQCDHCMSQVPDGAVVCAACGARWGSSTGRTRQQVYEEGKTKLKMGFVTGIVLLTFFLITIYQESVWIVLSMTLGFFAGPVCFGWMLGGFLSMQKAKTNLSIGWRRDT